MKSSWCTIKPIRHFIASLSDDLEYLERRVVVNLETYNFQYIYHEITGLFTCSSSLVVLTCLVWFREGFYDCHPLEAEVDGSQWEPTQRRAVEGGGEGLHQELRHCHWIHESPWLSSGTSIIALQQCSQIYNNDVKSTYKCFIASQESELIALMDEHGIGTDASIPQVFCEQ